MAAREYYRRVVSPTPPATTPTYIDHLSPEILTEIVAYSPTPKYAIQRVGAWAIRDAAEARDVLTFTLPKPLAQVNRRWRSILDRRCRRWSGTCNMELDLEVLLAAGESVEWIATVVQEILRRAGGSRFTIQLRVAASNLHTQPIQILLATASRWEKANIAIVNAEPEATYDGMRERVLGAFLPTDFRALLFLQHISVTFTTNTGNTATYIVSKVRPGDLRAILLPLSRTTTPQSLHLALTFGVPNLTIPLCRFATLTALSLAIWNRPDELAHVGPVLSQSLAKLVLPALQLLSIAAPTATVDMPLAVSPYCILRLIQRGEEGSDGAGASSLHTLELLNVVFRFPEDIKDTEVIDPKQHTPFVQSEADALVQLLHHPTIRTLTLSDIPFPANSSPSEPNAARANTFARLLRPEGPNGDISTSTHFDAFSGLTKDGVLANVVELTHYTMLRFPAKRLHAFVDARPGLRVHLKVYENSAFTAREKERMGRWVRVGQIDWEDVEPFGQRQPATQLTSEATIILED
ncbi:hypothetical protein MKEN_00842900 [Mycena kentingensis (nom. inval.)]|nr:hypothetical protein MKEN_00842900 [Mycena kentingensis (nom. inval.)]